jgi:cell wall-associated NlpC family hydrolase
MTGSRSRSAPVGLSLFLCSAIALFGLPGGEAQAHTRGNYRKARRHVEARAKKQLGTRYVYGGASPSGFDCSGFTMWVYGGHGASLPHRSIDQFRLGRKPRVKRIWKKKFLHTGDLVFFKTTGARVGHAGIYIGNGKFIHASSARGRVAKTRMGEYGAPFVGAVRLPVTRAKYG